MKVLLTGGAGYIGSHTALELTTNDFEVSILDNLSNSSVESIRRVENITGKKLTFFELDLLERRALNDIFDQNKFDAVIHFAGLKAVAESVEQPLAYYRNNIGGTINLCDAMQQYSVKNLVFSSSATIYGVPEHLPISEDARISETASPYGRTKLMIEELLKDICIADSDWNVALLRYFNPGGAHESGDIGEDPNGIPNNLLPYITQCAVGSREALTVFGDDYHTPDGTCIRDYIHVVDLALGHLSALSKLEQNPGLVTYNLGTGKGSSVLDVIQTFEKANEKKVPYVIGPRRPGDVTACYTDPSKAKSELGWVATKTLEDICRDAWRWQQKNPKGY
ncbi:MAG TPA: UDP-glucose 4-epimerase GalE [Gammaproteobacteria bacterium]|nr:UDP-glucose 4-epimerase GalE [Gammaproteobacteria bacterium]